MEFTEESVAILWSAVDDYGVLWLIMWNCDFQVFEIFSFAGYADATELTFEGQADSLDEAWKFLEELNA